MRQSGVERLELLGGVEEQGRSVGAASAAAAPALEQAPDRYSRKHLAITPAHCTLIEAHQESFSHLGRTLPPASERQVWGVSTTARRLKSQFEFDLVAERDAELAYLGDLRL
jgi:hypothetical protein